MNNVEFVAKLKELNACSEAVEFVGDKDFKTAWNKCVWADWMLWLICKMEIGTREERIHIICDCAATALKYVPKGEDRPRLAIEAARKYADERTPDNLEMLNTARAVAGAAGDAAWAAGAAWAAARAVAGAAGDAAWAAARAVAGAARAAAGAAARAAGDAAWAAARDAAHKKMCKMIRNKISIGEIK